MTIENLTPSDAPETVSLWEFYHILKLETASSSQNTLTLVSTNAQCVATDGIPDDIPEILHYHSEVQETI